jgi:tight adherence protein C
VVALLAWCGGLAAVIHAALRELEPTAFQARMPLRLLRPGVLLIAHYAGRRLRVTWRAEHKTRLLQAGVGPHLGPAEWFALRGVLAAVAAAAAAAVALRWGAAVWLAPLPAGAAGWLLPEVGLRLRIQRRRRRIARDLLLYLELLLAGLECGLVLRRALQAALATGPPGPLAAALAGSLEDACTGCEPDDILRRLARRLQTPASGAAIAAILRAQAAGEGLARGLHGVIARHERTRIARAEHSAQQAPRGILRALALGFAPSLIVAVGLPAAARLLA